MRSDRAPLGVSARVLVIALVLGAVFGVADRLLSLGPDWALHLSNVASLWLAAAFIAGASARRLRAAPVAGWLALVGALVGYYGYMYVVEHVHHLHYLEYRAAPWILASAVVGPIFGYLGARWSLYRSGSALIALAGAFVAEAAAFFLIVRDQAGGNDLAVHAGVLCVGVLLAVVFLVHFHDPARSERA